MTEHARPTGLDMGVWGPGVEHWQAGDRFYAVIVDQATDGRVPRFLTLALEEISSYEQVDLNTHQVLPRPTQLIRCDAEGVAIDADASTPAVELLVEHEFPPGTAAPWAMLLAGFEVTDA